MSRVVIKIGTNLLTLEDGSLNSEFIEKISREIKKLVTNGSEVALVTSGAVAAGRGELKIDRVDNETLHEKQALAAVGQGSLMQKYYKYFTLGEDIRIAQILLTPLDFENLDTLQNTHNTLKLLLTRKVLPIVNENDVTSTDELKYMANDKLAARVANLIGADSIILLTDVDGMFEEEPHENPKAKLVKTIDKRHLKKYFEMAGAAKANGHGGMQTKLEAAKLSECEVFIANGNTKNVLSKIVLNNENPGTVIR
ncbi:MAG: glutamate 5-kinase [Candidatus Peribacteraceae bacterium]|nr:glutamate 5-kinase [Candidatus Peribacteraceae bacterium]